MPMIVFAILFLWVADVLAADVLTEHGSTTNFLSDRPNAGDLVEALRIDPANGKSRGLRRNRAIQVESSDCRQVTRGLEVVPTKAVMLDIKFEFDSDQLTGEAQGILKELGLALKDNALASNSFVVEGHTDAAGSEGYNRDLSRRRALAVSSYLQVWHGVETRRLSISCKGESELLDPNDPMSGVNRRVHIINAG